MLPLGPSGAGGGTMEGFEGDLFNQSQMEVLNSYRDKSVYGKTAFKLTNITNGPANHR
ncbi:hypothetical protein MTBLM5_10021 [Magnetospirillum sp. LM-5]|nr:hypothetical protein MTBLM5_10021 [Magnetospirillum sp. LM-5]